MGEGSQHRIQRSLRLHTHVRSGAAAAPADSGRGTAQPLQELRQTEAGGKAGNDPYPPAKQNIRPKTIVFRRTMGYVDKKDTRYKRGHKKQRTPRK